MVRLTASIYRIKKRSEHVLDCVQYLTHETEKQQALENIPYNDSEIKANFDFRAQLVEEECACAGWSFLNETDSLRSLIQRVWLFMSYRANQSYQNDSRNLISSVWYYRDPLNAFVPYQLLHLCRRWKSWFRNWERLLSKALARSMYPHLTEDGEIFFEAGSDGALFTKYDGQPVIIWNDRQGSQLRESWGCRNVYNVLIPHQQSPKAEYKIFINQTD